MYLYIKNILGELDEWFDWNKFYLLIYLELMFREKSDLYLRVCYI